MGQQASVDNNSKKRLEEATKSAEKRLGTLTITGRYHRLPKKIEDDYIFEKKVLGTGYNGAVYQAHGRQSKKKYAVKSFKLRRVPQYRKEEFKNEVEIFLSLDHTHIVRLVDAYENEENLHLVMECLEGGELVDRVLEKQRFSERDAAHTVWQMLLAINYLHAHGIVHRDIKSENWLYEKKDSDWLKLIDFGFSKVWAANTQMAESCGTLAYIAPEVLNGEYGSQCDLWSIGVITFILVLGYMPFSEVDKIKQGAFVYKKEIWESSPAKAREFAMCLLQVNPEKRLTAAQALQHPWIQEGGRGTTDKLDESIIKSLCTFAQETRFKRAAFSVMAWSMGRDDRLDVREAFIALDKGNKGTITLADLKEVMQARFEINNDQIKEVFAALSTDDQGEIRYSEFLAAMAASRIRLHEDLLRETFRRFDKDNSGYISIENLQEILGEEYSDPKAVQELLSEAGMGANGQVSWEEFIEKVSAGDAELKASLQEVADKIIDKEVSNPSLNADIVGELENQLKSKKKLRHRFSSALAARGNAFVRGISGGSQFGRQFSPFIRHASHERDPNFGREISPNKAIGA